MDRMTGTVWDSLILAASEQDIERCGSVVFILAYPLISFEHCIEFICVVQHGNETVRICYVRRYLSHLS